MTAVHHDEQAARVRGGPGHQPRRPCRSSTSTPTPDRYRHWRLDVDGEVATLTLAVDEDGGLVPGYELKMNSYDLGVDIELYDAVQRLRFEHPEVKAVVLTGGLDRMFCAGANIRMLAQSSHAWKVNFCKFTNETRNGIEDATAHSRPDLDRRAQRHRGRRRLRAGAGLRRDRADRRRLLDRLAARGAAARRAAGHRRADPGGRQALRPQGPRRRVRHQVRGLPRGHRRAVGPGRRDRAPSASSTRRSAERAQRGRSASSPARRRHRASQLTPLDAHRATATRSPTRTSPRRSTAAARRVDITVQRADARRRRPTPRRCSRRASDYWPLAVTRALDDLILRLRTNEPELGTWVLPHPRRRRPGAGLRRAARASWPTTGSSTRCGHYLQADCSSGSTSPAAA